MNRKYIIAAVVVLSLVGGAYYLYTRPSSKVPSFDPNEAQKQIDYSQAIESVAESKPFIKKLPYRSSNFDIYYDTVDEQIQVIMKDRGLTYNQTKSAIEADVIVFLQGIGVDVDKQKIVWLLEQ